MTQSANNLSFDSKNPTKTNPAQAQANSTTNNYTKATGQAKKLAKIKLNRTTLLVAACTTNLQTPSATDRKKQSTAQTLGCGCAKALFPTTTNTKQLHKEPESHQ